MKYEFSLDQKQIVLLVMASLGLSILIFTAGWLVGNIFPISETPTAQKKTIIRSQRAPGYKPKASVKIIKQKVPAIPKPQPEPIVPPPEEKISQVEKVPHMEKPPATEPQPTGPESIAKEKKVQPAPAEEPLPPTTTRITSVDRLIAAISPAPAEEPPLSAPPPPPTRTAPVDRPVAAIASPPAVELYAVQVGAFLSKDNADRFMRRLNQKDYQAYIFQVTGAKERVWHAVRIGSYQDLEAARSDAAAFKDKEKMPAMVMYFDSLNPVYLKKGPGQQ